jgi:hypothetical protein
MLLIWASEIVPLVVVKIVSFSMTECIVVKKAFFRMVGIDCEQNCQFQCNVSNGSWKKTNNFQDGLNWFVKNVSFSMAVK